MGQLGLRYMLIAAVTFCAYFVFLYFWTSLVHASYPVAVGISYGAALVIHFLANRSYTFRSGASAIRGQLLRYLITALLNYFVQILVIYTLFQLLGVNFYLAALVAVCANLVVGFVLQHNWVFAGR